MLVYPALIWGAATALSTISTLFFPTSASRIECQNPKLNFTIHRFPIDKEKAELHSNYEITLRSTNWLRQNETSKFLEQDFDGTLIMRKWTRTAETGWYNRSVLFEDHYHKPDAHHLEHNRSCKALNNSLSDQVNSLALSPRLLHALKIDGASFGQLLAKFVEQPQYNGTFYNVQPILGVEVVGWLGCIHNFSGQGQDLQLNIRFAGDHTSEEPYNPYWSNPLVYTVDLVFYEVTTNDLLDSLTFDMVTLDRVHLADKEFVMTPPHGIYCDAMKATPLPVHFPLQFSAQIFSTHQKTDKEGGDVYKTTQNMYFYDGQERIVAYTPELFQPPTSSNNEDEEDGKQPKIGQIIHDFVYGFQYTISANGTCHSVAPIDPNAPDVSQLPIPPPPNGTDAADTQPILYMLHPEETLIWRGRRQRMGADDLYYAGKVKSSDTGEPLAVYSTLRPAEKQQWEERYIQKESGSEKNGTELVELLFSLDSHGHPFQFHSIVAYNSTMGSHAGERLETQRILEQSGKRQSAWRALRTIVRPCIQLFSLGDVTFANETNNSDFYTQLANVTLSQLVRMVGYERALAAVAEALAQAANVSQLRIVDLQLKQMNSIAAGPPSGILVALFSIGKPVEGVKPAKTGYLKEEITVKQAAAALNESITAHRLHIRIPLEKPKKDWNITANAFGPQSDLHPGPSPPTPPPTPPPGPSFVGYSGSSLAICSFFAFILGVGFVLSAYVFYQKRQHIRGIAYQVFE